jgi:hypothetical protein
LSSQTLGFSVACARQLVENMVRAEVEDRVHDVQADRVVFGSGFGIVPFLYGGVVGHYHWLTERQSVDAVAEP